MNERNTVDTMHMHCFANVRSKLNSGTFFIGEQPNPWNLLQLQEKISQHRGAKPSRR